MNNIQLALTEMSDFISANARDNAFFCIEQSLESCAEVFRCILKMWVVLGGM